MPRFNGVPIYIGQRRPTLVGGDVATLGHGFNLGGILRAGAGILGAGARAALGLPAAPKSAVGPNAFALPTSIIPAGSIAAGAVDTFGKVVKATFPFSPGEQLRQGLFPSGGGRRRRMNPLNLRALTRADRRVTRFADIARKYVSPTSAHRRVRAFKRRKR